LINKYAVDDESHQFDRWLVHKDVCKNWNWFMAFFIEFLLSILEFNLNKNIDFAVQLTIIVMVACRGGQ